MTEHTIDELLAQLPEPPGPDPEFEDRVRRAVAAELRGDAATVATARSESEEPTTTEVIDLETATRPSTPHIEPPRRQWLRAAAAVVVIGGLLATAAVLRRDDPQVASGTTPVFEDGFDDDSAGWTTGSSPGVLVTTGGGQQVWTLRSSGIRELLRPFAMDENLRDMEVTADVLSIDPGATLGVLCRKGQIAAGDATYSFRLGAEGASIVDVDIVAPLASDSTVEVPSGPFSLTARCVDEDGVAHLEMLIDGEVVLTAQSDDPIEAGVGGIEAIADADLAPSDDPEIVLDTFVVNRIG